MEHLGLGFVRRHRLYVLVSVVCLLLTCTLFVGLNTHSLAGPDVELLISDTKLRITRFLSNEDRHIRELYFTRKPKEILGKDVIIHLLEDESRKFRSERRKTLQEESKNLTDYEQNSLNFTYIEKEGGKTIDFKKFMGQYIDLLNRNRLSFPHPERLTTSDGKPIIWDTLFMDKPFDILSESVLYDQMDFDEEFIKDLKMKHRIIIDSLPTVSPPNLYHDSGYVMIGGGRYTWFAFLAIQALRRTGSKLPVELMIPDDDDWESWLCDDVLPNQYNVKCVTFSSIYGEEMLKKVEELKGYQFKSFALLGSSFENAFYLDSDDFAVKNPDVLFESDLYKKYQMITWPDFWRRTSSPSLYSVLGIKVGSVPIRCLNDLFTPVEKYTTKNDLVAVEERVNYHDRRGTLTDWSTESGQFLFNKTLHFNTLLLSLYYNYDGPAGYHPLISQGGAGEGDKETYTLAAHYLKKMYYQVYKKPDKLYGTFIKASNWYVDSTIVQMDPLVDYENLKKLIMKNRASQDEGKEYTYNYEYAYGSIASSGSFNSEPMFYHIHAPKMDPFEYVKKNLFTDMKDQPIRNFGYDFPKIGFDIELWIWKTVLESLCERSHDEQFSCFEGANLTIICSNPLVESRMSWLEETGIPMLHDYRRQNFPESPKLTEVEGKDLDDLIYGKLEDSLDFGYL